MNRMKPQRMLELSLLCRNEDKERIISILAGLELLHITDHKRERIGDATIDIGTPMESAEELSSALVTARNLLAKIKADAPPADDALHLSNRVALVRELGAKYSHHEQERERISTRIKEIDAQLTLLEQLPADEPLAALKTRSTVSALLKCSMDDLGDLTPLYLKENREHGSIFVTVERKDAGALDGFERIDLAGIAHHTGTARSASGALAHERHILRSELTQQERELASFAQHAAFLTASEPIIALELLKAQAPLRFGTTRNLTIIRGFIPATRERELSDALEGLTTLHETTPARDAPTAFDNPRQVRDFESLVSLYTLPKYDEIDPTSLMAFTFPLFFGFMLGDIGYGLVALAAAWYLRAHVPKMREIGGILMLSAAATIAFGIVYGEFFGAESILGIVHLTPLLHRTQDIMLMFGIAIAIGAVHLNLGLVLGIINEWEDGPLLALARKGGWMLLQAAAVLLAMSYNLVPASLTAVARFAVPGALAWLVLAAAIACIAYGERLRGILELPMIFSNMLSYTRLVALGLASVYLALVVNEMALGLFAKGGLWLALGAIILLLGHAVNLLLGLLGPFLHSLRLHYVEFFGKFYEGGGRPYTPFGKRGGQAA